MYVPGAGIAPPIHAMQGGGGQPPRKCHVAVPVPLLANPTCAANQKTPQSAYTPIIPNKSTRCNIRRAANGALTGLHDSPGFRNEGGRLQRKTLGGLGLAR